MLLVSIAAAISSAAEAQSDPLRCWWRTSQGAVSIGETFDAVLTCAIREQDMTRTVVDESRLAAAVVQLAPFEVLSGTHPADLRSPTHRFFQYHYAVRIIDRDVIGRDAKFPDVPLTYRVQHLTSGEWVAGRERTYVISGQPVRVLSLVPAEANDIRDAADASFAQVETLRFRGRMLEWVAYALLAVGAIVAVPAVLALTKRRRADQDASQPALPRRAIWRTVESELDSIERESRNGWNQDLVARAIGAVRLGGAAVLQRPVAVHPLAGMTPGAGRLLVSRGLLQKQHFAISSPLTAADLSRASSKDDDAAERSATSRQALDELATAMRSLTATLYAATFVVDNERLSDVFTSARSALRRLAPR
jgi:hypothetical protein